MIAAHIRAAASLLTAATLVGAAAAPPDLSAAKPAVASSNSFGVDFFRTLAMENPEGNLFISPYSLSIALTMAAEGASGETAKQLDSVLHLSTGVQTGAGAGAAARAIAPVHAGYAALSSYFTAATGSTDPAVRERMAALRTQLDAANTLTRTEEGQNHWQQAMASHQEASRIAGELNVLLATVDRFDLRVANALWVDGAFALTPTYGPTLERYYGTGAVTALDMAHDTEGSRTRINGWVEDHTEHRIKDLIPSGMLTPVSRLVITNAVYFRGQWATPFAESSTAEQDFTLSSGKAVKTRMMNDYGRGGVPYAAFTGAGEYFTTPDQVPVDPAKRPATYPDDAGFSMIELPYKGGDLSMVLIAPRTPQGLPALESKLTAPALTAWFAQMKARTVETALPRFKLESTLEASDALKSMGMKRAFVSPDLPGGAQFPGISPSADPALQLFISAVLHKAWVEVTEKGTEAAAATAVVMAAPSMAVPPPELVPFTPQFRADHPFVFVIRDTKTGVILFMGRMTNPSV